MKSIKNVYITLTKERIKEIIVLASRGKRNRREVQRVLQNIDTYTEKVYQMIQNKTYYMLPSHHRTINEKGKERLLTISPFYPNRILDYIVVETVKPYIKKSMYEYCIGNVDKRGMMFGKDKIVKDRNKYKYFIKLDIHKFYPSLPNKELMGWIQSRIRDKDFMELTKAVCGTEDGLPIGSYYSQWFSNWFLQELDHKIKEEWGIELYIRYVDDMLLMSNNKRKLLKTMYLIRDWLNSHGLDLKRIEQAYTLDQRPIDFLGFRIYKNKVCLRTSSFHRMNKRMKKIRRNKHTCVSQARGMLAYVGWLKQTKLGYLYYTNHIKPYCKIGELRRIVSVYDIKHKGR